MINKSYFRLLLFTKYPVPQVEERAHDRVYRAKNQHNNHQRRAVVLVDFVSDAYVDQVGDENELDD